VKKAKKKKKPRYPKGWDPSLPNGGMKEPPNPERWLPKWQRSDFKKKQRRRRDRQVGLGRQVPGGEGGGPHISEREFQTGAAVHA
jgi:signal recognition particle subunit SRP72